MSAKLTIPARMEPLVSTLLVDIAVSVLQTTKDNIVKKMLMNAGQETLAKMAAFAGIPEEATDANVLEDGSVDRIVMKRQPNAQATPHSALLIVPRQLEGTYSSVIATTSPLPLSGTVSRVQQEQEFPLQQWRSITVVRMHRAG